MSLKARLVAEIAADGPMRVDAFVLRCLWDPRDGYYATRPTFGAGGDFLTAPHVSQIFGELLGLWAVQAWMDLGRPAAFSLVELGPGDGLLMADLLRAARVAPDFLAAADLVLVEPSRPLRERQRAALAGAPLTPSYAADLTAIDADRPMLVVANEVLDCLPARQFVRIEGGWAERRIGVDGDGELSFALAAPPAGFVAPAEAAPGQVVEVSAAQEGFAAALAGRVATAGGAALLIDYGRDAPGVGDTLQALRDHRKTDPLADPGRCDLTMWADFPAVASAARAQGAVVAGPLPQGTFLRRLGLDARVAALARAAPDLAVVMARQASRLADNDGMGALFKAICFYRTGQPVPPGFEEVRLD